MSNRAYLPALIACICTVQANAGPRGDLVGRRVDATWRVQSIVFNHSASTAYSCVSLREKIVTALKAVGGNDGAIVAITCTGGLLRSARVNITLASPVEVTAERLPAPTPLDSRAELIARVHGMSISRPAAVERFPATWRRISFGRNGPRRLDARDCELLRGMVKQVFPRLAIRVDGGPLCIDGMTRAMPRKIVARVRDSR